MRLLLAIVLLLSAANVNAECRNGICGLKLKSAAKAVILAPAKIVTAAVAAPSKCCHSGITPTASVRARPGFMGWNRWKVAKRAQRGGFIARLRFKPG